MVVNYAFGALGVVYAGSFAYLYLRCKDRLAFGKYLSNHVLMFAPLNFLFTFFIRGQSHRCTTRGPFPASRGSRRTTRLIRAEAKVLLDTGVFQRPPATDEPGYNTFEKGGWRMYPLKWYTKECGPSAVRACPKTCAVHGFDPRCSLRDVHRPSTGRQARPPP